MIFYAVWTIAFLPTPLGQTSRNFPAEVELSQSQLRFYWQSLQQLEKIDILRNPWIKIKEKLFGKPVLGGN